MVKSTATYKNRATGDRGGNASARIRVFRLIPGARSQPLPKPFGFARRKQRCITTSQFSVSPLPRILLRPCRWHLHSQSQTMHEGLIAPKTLNVVAQMAGRLLHVAGRQVGILIRTRQNAWLHISSGDLHRATTVKRSPVSRPSFPRKPILIDGLSNTNPPSRAFPS